MKTPLRWGLLLGCLLLASGHEWGRPSTVEALPSGGQVAGGSATIQSTGQTMTIQQQSNNALLNWQGFSIGSKEAVHIQQPGVSSLMINRVLGGDPSMILGQLLANGRVFLLNPNGVVFGPGAVVNVGSLLASTLSLQKFDLAKGEFKLAQDPTKALAAVINQGTIRAADHGFVILTAPGVVNEGLIVAKFGHVGLGAGTQMAVDFRGDGLIQYAVDGKVMGQVTDPNGKPLTAAITNSGRIEADGGTVLLTAQASSTVLSSVINQTGVIQARRLEQQGGEIVLRGGDDGAVMVAGSLEATGTAKGGTIDVRGNLVGLAATAKLDVSGETGGGTITVGGGFQGKDNGPHAQQTVVLPGATLAANAITQGDGGTVIVWADGTTKFGGDVSARGGPQGGNGGFVEVSGKHTLLFAGTADTSAPIGRTGTLLLDPDEITIVHDVAANTSNINCSGGGTCTTPSGGPFTDIAPNYPPTTGILTDGTINAQLNLNHVTVQTSTDTISISNSSGTVVLGPTSANTNTLTLNSASNIAWNAGWSYTNAGQLTLYASGGNISGNGALTLGGTSPVLLQASTGIGSSGTPLSTSGLSALAAKTATGGIFITESASSNVLVTLLTNPVTAVPVSGVSTTTSGDVTLTNTAADLTVNRPVAAAGALTLGAARSLVMNNDGTTTFGGMTTLNGDITLTANNGGAAAGNFIGVNINGGTIDAGTQDITITGHGGTTGANNYGVAIHTNQAVTDPFTPPNSSAVPAVLQTTGGTITITGTGGTGTGQNVGVFVYGSNTHVSNTTGPINMTGTGGSVGGQNWGLFVLEGAQITSTTGALTLIGTGGLGTDENIGVVLRDAGTLVTSNTGAITITGEGRGSGNFNVGIDMLTGAQVTSTGDGGGEVKLTGMGGNGTTQNIGVVLFSPNTKVSSTTAPITIRGTGGASSGQDNFGISLDGGSQVTSTSGPLTLIGIGGAGTDNNFGVFMTSSGATSTVSSSTGPITITGTSGGTRNFNIGIAIAGNASVASTGDGAGAVMLTGTGGPGVNDNSGILLSVGTITTKSGPLTLTGTGAGSGVNNVGIRQVFGTSSVTSTGTAPITLSGQGAGGSPGIESLGTFVIGGPAAAGDITVLATNLGKTGDSVQLAAGLTFQGTATLNLAPLDASDTIGLTGGVGLFNLSTAELSAIQNGFSQIVIGRANGTGAVTVGLAGFTFQDPLTIQSNLAGGPGAIAVNGPLATQGNDSLTLRAGQSVVVDHTGGNLGAVTTTAGTLTLQGNVGGTAIGNFVGVDVNGATLSTTTGGMTLTGIGGTTGTNNFGVQLRNGAQLTTTSGAVNLTGTGGTGVNGNTGIHLEGAGTQVVSTDGDIVFHGTGGNGSGIANRGIELLSGAQVNSTGTGPSAATISFFGDGGTGTSFNHGIAIAQSGSQVSSVDGSITLEGTAGGTAGVLGSNIGVSVALAGKVQSTGTGSIEITGFGGAGVGISPDLNAPGIFLSGGGQVTTATGNITMVGSGDGTGNADYGLILRTGALVQSTGGGTIDMTGTGSTTGVSFNNGVVVADSGTLVQSSNTITLHGTAGGDGTGFGNLGVSLAFGSVVQGVGATNVNLTGIGGAGTGQDYGVFLRGPSQVLSDTGNIVITGTATDGVTPVGVFLTNSPVITTSPPGSVTINSTPP